MTLKLAENHAWVADQINGIIAPGFSPEELESEVVAFLLTQYRPARIDARGIQNHASVSVRRHLWRVMRRERRRRYGQLIDHPEPAKMAGSVERLDRLRVRLRCCPDPRAKTMLKIVDAVMDQRSFRSAITGVQNRSALFRWVARIFKEK